MYTIQHMFLMQPMSHSLNQIWHTGPRLSASSWYSSYSVCKSPSFRCFLMMVDDDDEFPWAETVVEASPAPTTYTSSPQGSTPSVLASGPAKDPTADELAMTDSVSTPRNPPELNIFDSPPSVPPSQPRIPMDTQILEEESLTVLKCKHLCLTYISLIVYHIHIFIYIYIYIYRIYTIAPQKKIGVPILKGIPIPTITVM